VTPFVSETLRSSVSSPVFLSSMYSYSSLSKVSPTKTAGLYITSVTRRSARIPAAMGSPARNCTGADQWLQRPEVSFIRQRTRYVCPSRTTEAGIFASALNAVSSALSQRGSISYLPGSRWYICGRGRPRQCHPEVSPRSAGRR
jgi:hypothetical protein